MPNGKTASKRGTIVAGVIALMLLAYVGSYGTLRVGGVIQNNLDLFPKVEAFHCGDPSNPLAFSCSLSAPRFYTLSDRSLNAIYWPLRKIEEVFLLT
ncbi:MAG: hypothetical protein ABFD92_16350 [Planctomycetaceae bacterium]|nr:hypothetical protein [Planctomycetaceae bacterium]